MSDDKVKHINFALVEEKRPALYRAMKYWGKKPHNIWREYIDRYTPEQGLYLDPFAGSAISAFEAVKAGKKAVAFDLNPLTSFFIEVVVSDFREKYFKEKVLSMIDEIEKDKIYQKYYRTKCHICDKKNALAQNFKWENDSIYEVGVECTECEKANSTTQKIWKKKKRGVKITRSLKKPDDSDNILAEDMKNIDINVWFPQNRFPNSPSFSAGFIECIGGNTFDSLWTRRNLYVLSKIFDLILKEEDEELKQQLIFGFIQTVHLCTKMSVPRRIGAKRPFSTSWGRSAYICTARQMEMNPVGVFESSCIGRQSVKTALSKVVDYVGKKPKILYVDKSNKSNRSKNFDIKYGIIDINNLTDYLDKNTVDFIMTDPPYGDLVQYMDLSSIWLVWLEHYDSRFKPNYEAEITIKKGQKDLEAYRLQFLNGIKNLYKVLKEDGYIVFTFHNKDINIWNTFLKSLSLAGFKIQKVIHQQNRRTGESNVANPYGTSASDFYLRCIKAPHTSMKTDMGQFEHFVLTKAIEIIAERNEPTPYQFLFNGLLAEISGAGFDLKDFDTNLEKILSKYVGDVFVITENTENGAGKLWWFKDPEQHIKYPDKKLTERVEESVVALLRRKVAVSLDEVIAEIFTKYPNGLTPDIHSIDNLLKKYAAKSGGKWVYKGQEVEKDFTEHTRILALLNEIAKKTNLKTYIGKREQPEQYNGKRLREIADYKNLKILSGYDSDQTKRLGMIDMLWIKNNKVSLALEVENSTKFTSGIQRGSNLDNTVPKIMVIPDKRKNELLSITDPLFIDSFQKHNWKYLLYSDVEKLNSKKDLKISSLEYYLKDIKQHV